MADKIETAQEKLNGQVMGRAGVTGTAIGMVGGRPGLKVYVESKEAARKVSIPGSIGGFKVDVEVSGSFKRY